MSSFAKMTVAEISRYLKETVPTAAELAELSADGRVGVRRLVQSCLHDIHHHKYRK